MTFPIALAFSLWLLQASSAINFTGKSANVNEAGVAIKINLFQWSSDADRAAVTAALDPEAQKAAQAPAAARGRGGRGGRAARGGLDPDDPALADLVATGARGARGGRGRGGRGDGSGGTPPDSIATLTSALGKAPTVGYLWTNEVVGYSIKYAHHLPLPDGGERIVLITERRLGTGKGGWTIVGNNPQTDYEFTLIEMRVDAKGIGEGKTSLSNKVVFDAGAKTLALDNYAAAPVVLQGIKR